MRSWIIPFLTVLLLQLTACVTTKSNPTTDPNLFQEFVVIASDISKDGQTVVGVIADGPPSYWETKQQAFFLKGERTGIIDNTDPWTSRVQRVSADGTISIGTIVRTQDSPQQTVLWKDGTSYNLNGLDGTPGVVVDISDKGDKIVMNSKSRACLHDTKEIHSLGTLGGQYSWAYAISGDGSTIIGKSTDSNRQLYPVVWRYGVIERLPGNRFTTPKAISTDGKTIAAAIGEDETGIAIYQNQELIRSETVAGGIFNLHLSGNGYILAVMVKKQTPYIIELVKASRPVPLKEYLQRRGANTDGWDFNTINGFSENGNIIIGFGRFKGKKESWIANLSPEIPNAAKLSKLAPPSGKEHFQP